MLSAFAPPSRLIPLYSWIETFGSAKPLKLTLRYIVMWSPSKPESLYPEITGVEGCAGGTVSTEKLNGVIV